MKHKIAMVLLVGFWVSYMSFEIGRGFPHPYRPYGNLSLHQAETEVLVHKTDPHKTYTCENDPVIGNEPSGHYAVIDQIEALDAGYTPMGEGYCQ